MKAKVVTALSDTRRGHGVNGPTSSGDLLLTAGPQAPELLVVAEGDVNEISRRIRT